LWAKVSKLRALSWPDRLRVAEALLALMAARIALAALPFRRIAAWLGREGVEGAPQAGAEREAQAMLVGRAVQRVAPHVPWDSRCLAQAIAGAWMLGRRGLPATIYFGVRKDPGAAFTAHAWLRCGGCIVTGAREHETFEIIARFSRAGREEISS
jgi:hypothetical protein